MNVYTYSEARRKLASVLDEADARGEVRISRRDGRMFALRPVPRRSPLDVPPVAGASMSLEEINESVREGRARGMRNDG